MIELAALDMAGTTIEEHGDVYAALRAAVEAEGAAVDDALVQRWMGTDKREAITDENTELLIFITPKIIKTS